MNHVHKDTNYLVSTIITMVTNINGWDTVFYDRGKSIYLVNRAHVLKHLHDRMIFGPF